MTTIETIGNVTIVDYSEKAIALVGETKPIKEAIKAIGGKFNKYLKCGPGWIFPKKKFDKVRELLFTEIVAA